MRGAFDSGAVAAFDAAAGARTDFVVGGGPLVVVHGGERLPGVCGLGFGDLGGGVAVEGGLKADFRRRR